MKLIDINLLRLSVVLLFCGAIMTWLDCIFFKTGWISGISCSIVASSGMMLLNILLVEKRRPLDEWKMSKIYERRADKNADSDPKLKDVKHMVDGIAFGLSNFRAKQSPKVEECLMRGVNFRFITMDPDGQFTAQRDIEEGDEPGHLKNSISKFIEWADRLNEKGYPGKITIKGYSCMTLDFYWRMDDEIYMGPYWYGMPSQQTVTYKFENGGKGYSIYSDYFERLWNNDKLLIALTKG